MLVLGIRQDFQVLAVMRVDLVDASFLPELIGSFRSPSQTSRAPLSCFVENVTFNAGQIVSGLRVCWILVVLPLTPV